MEETTEGGEKEHEWRREEIRRPQDEGRRDILVGRQQRSERGGWRKCWKEGRRRKKKRRERRRAGLGSTDLLQGLEQENREVDQGRGEKRELRELRTS